MNTTAQFEKYLKEVKSVSKNTVRFYRSDLNHFVTWIIEKLKPLGVLIESVDEALPYLNNTIVEEYKNFLVNSQVATKTINRRLSTLRIYSGFLVSENHITSDFTGQIGNISTSIVKPIARSNKDESILNHFQAYLKDQGASANTIKNYMADVKQFFDWMNASVNTTN